MAQIYELDLFIQDLPNKHKRKGTLMSAAGVGTETNIIIEYY